MKKGILRRIAAAGLAVVTLLGMSMATMAEDKTGVPNQGAVETTAAGMGTLVSNGTETGTITVNGMAEGDVATLYKIVNITYNPATNSKDYAWANGVQAAVQSAWTTDTTTQLTPANFKAKFESDADFQSKVYQKILVAINSNNENEKAGEEFGTSKTAGESGSVVFEDVPFGQYIVKITGTNVYAPITATLDPEAGVETKVDGKGNKENPDNYYIHNVVIDAKRATPSIEKEITDPTDKTVAVNDNVDYKITVTAPTFDPEAKDFTFNVNDSMEAGIIGANNLVIKNGTNTDESLTAGTDISAADKADYRITYYSKDTLESGSETTATENARGFKIEFNMHKAAVNGQKLTITYTSKVEKITIGKEIKNKATLIWPKNIWTTDTNNNRNTEETNVPVKSFGLKVQKVDSTDTTKGLKGAEFKLYKSAGDAEGNRNPIELVQLTNDAGVIAGAYRVANTVGTGSGDTKVDTITTTNDGHFTIDGLDATTYYVKETKAPTGYVLKNEPVAVTIGKVNTYTSDKITNTKGFTLPQTGDAAMFIMSIVGAGLVVFGVAFFALSRGKSRKQSRR
nr:SpaH/EbpB family LPXTG-anchored major pilin [uncultured Mediterraneibacter sp.]